MQHVKFTRVGVRGDGYTTYRIWAYWAVATTTGGTLGEIALRVAENNLSYLPPILSQLIGWALLGGVLGALQWLVLRQRIADVSAWIPASAIGAALSFPIANALFGTILGFRGGLYLLLVMGVIGFVFGAAQSLVLQRRVRGGLGWVAASAFAWPFEHVIAVYLARLSGRVGGGIVGWPEIVGWSIYGVLMGFMFIRLLKRSK